MTDRVNALWDAFYGRRQVAGPAVTMTDKDIDVEKGVRREERPSVSHDALVFPIITELPQTRRLWSLDSDVEINLGRRTKRMLSPELDHSVPPRTVRVCEDANTTHTLAPKQNPILTDRVSKNSNPDRRTDKFIKRRAVSAEMNPRRTVKGDDGRRNSRGRSTSDDRQGEKRRGGRNQPSKSPRSTSRNNITPRDNTRRTMRDGSPNSSESLPCTQDRPHRNRPQTNRDRLPPDDDGDGDGSDGDYRNSDRRRRGRRRRSRSRRRREPSSDDDTPDDGDNGDGPTGGSSSKSNGLGPTARSHRKFRIKPQKFDGSGSWESWWAHFQNCATYNRWTERDKLAFLKGALTGSAAQVLWDTDRSTTNSLERLLAVLESRCGGERQAEKHRAELQIRRRKTGESLSDLHQDIRRLTVLAYPKLSTDAREEIGSDHFTNALGDPDLASKVERSPKSLDEAHCVALRLEAWAKSVKRDRQVDDRIDRPRQMARATAKPEPVRATNIPDFDDRVAKLEAGIRSLREEIKRLVEFPQAPSASPRYPVDTFCDCSLSKIRTTSNRFGRRRTSIP